ncbi:MAG: hypothetical protein LBP29_06355, partial [Treponema sp.]|nr:hypothetical protein [Treponema sp.]
PPSHLTRFLDNLLYLVTNTDKYTSSLEIITPYYGGNIPAKAKNRSFSKETAWNIPLSLQGNVQKRGVLHE